MALHFWNGKKKKKGVIRNNRKILLKSKPQILKQRREYDLNRNTSILYRWFYLSFIKIASEKCFNLKIFTGRKFAIL